MFLVTNLKVETPVSKNQGSRVGDLLRYVELLLSTIFQIGYFNIIDFICIPLLSLQDKCSNIKAQG